MRYCIDTNVFIRLFVEENKRMTRECAAFFDWVEQTQADAFTPSCVHAEIVWVLSSVYRLPRTKIAGLIETIMAAGISIEDTTDMAVAISWYRETRVKFIDCLIAAQRPVLAGQAVVVSYDKEFDKLGIRRVEPAQVIKK